MFSEKIKEKEYRVEVTARSKELDIDGKNALFKINEYGLKNVNDVRAVKVYIIKTEIETENVNYIAKEFLADPVVEMFAVNKEVIYRKKENEHTVEIAKKPGVMEPIEFSVMKGVKALGFKVNSIHTVRKYIVHGNIEKNDLENAVSKVLANNVIEQIVIDQSIDFKSLQTTAKLQGKNEINLKNLTDEQLIKLSKEGQLYFSLDEIKTIQKYYEKIKRNPTDIELETLAQTWSEHCGHKTFRGKIKYKENNQKEEVIDNLLKSTIAKVTNELNKEWCWSVFEDNSGVIDFDGKQGVAFKVETHNHPSAIEPYGGAGTGLGGVIRDPLGTGLGAKPILNTDVFCFAPPDYKNEELPKGVLHPARVMRGVVAGVGDYGNRMGIPTANGALVFDKRFIGNPLVFCGTVAVIPEKFAKLRKPKPGQIALVVGGRTGRDGIHGATFSSVELDENSEEVSSGAVQIGNPIEEKKVADFLLRARDAGLYSCITDCGAGGLSSALGEMGAGCGVRVELDKVPLKYEGLTYTEIWISEAQERMVIATDENNILPLKALAQEENVEITPIAKFTNDNKLTLLWDGAEVGEIEMEFLHNGLPRLERNAVWNTPRYDEPENIEKQNYNEELKKILANWTVCSKEDIIRQYDHEVQGTSVIKPLVGEKNDGPGDAVVITPILGEKKAIAVANGINPAYADIDPYWMAAAAIDEALRNIVCVGASIEKCAILDNFCWGNCDNTDRLAGLVRAAKACYDIAIQYGVPFISGKDSLNNEFITEEQTIVIPGTLLISALAVMDDCYKALTMDVKKIGNLIYIVGVTKNELGGSYYYKLKNAVGNNVPKVDTNIGKKIFKAIPEASEKCLIRSAHDCSEGGIAVALAEMAFAGGLGVNIKLDNMPVNEKISTEAALFSESTSRIILEVEPEKQNDFENIMQKHQVKFAKIGEVIEAKKVVIEYQQKTVINEDIKELKNAWQKPLKEYW